MTPLQLPAHCHSEDIFDKVTSLVVEADKNNLMPRWECNVMTRTEASVFQLLNNSSVILTTHCGIPIPDINQSPDDPKKSWITAKHLRFIPR